MPPLNDKPYLPDTSAILTLLENEDGADTVENILRHKKILLPAIVLLEVFYVGCIRNSRAAAEARYALLKQLRAEHLSELTEPVIIQAGEFKANYRLSLADAVIAAYALVFNAILVHKDPEYEPLDMLQQAVLPCKPH